LQAEAVSTKGTIQALVENTSTLSNLVSSVQQPQIINTSGSVADFTAAINMVKPSVVIIEAQKVAIVFPGRRVIQQSAGSGWVIGDDGFIVTNNHVVADATSIKVTLADGRSFPSVAVRADAVTDLAVIKIDARNLPVAMIGDSDRLQVGQPVAAIGNALGLGINMTGGWISRLNTSITFSDGGSLSGLIGTDAAINPGNSGGPLITIDGEVVGITNAKLVQTGVEGIGYAISINNALKTINSLIDRL
jgi:S1-C subfamily serine protease